MKLLFESKFGVRTPGFWGDYFVMVGTRDEHEIFLKFLTDLAGVFHAYDANRHTVSNRHFIRFDLPDNNNNNNKRILYPFGTEEAILNFCKIMGYKVYEEFIYDGEEPVEEGRLVDYDLFSN